MIEKVEIDLALYLDNFVFIFLNLKGRGFLYLIIKRFKLYEGTNGGHLCIFINVLEHTLASVIFFLGTLLRTSRVKLLTHNLGCAGCLS